MRERGGGGGGGWMEGWRVGGGNFGKVGEGGMGVLTL